MRLIVLMLVCALATSSCGTGFCSFQGCEDGSGTENGAAGFNIGTGFTNTANVVKISSSGHIYVAGAFLSYNGSGISRVARLNTDGSLDTSFSPPSIDGSVNAILLRTNGTGGVYIAGLFDSVGGAASRKIALLSPTGSLDTSFNVGLGFNGGVSDIQSTRDGSRGIYAAGQFVSYGAISSPRLVRILSTGAPDLAFAVGLGFTQEVESIAVNVDNKVYAAGQFPSFQAVVTERAAYVDQGGTLDGAFAVTGVSSAFNATTFTVVQATDGSGDVYFGGAFTTFQGTPVERVVRINSDGSIDTSVFNSLSGANGTVTDIEEVNGGLFLAGQFTTYQGANRNRLVKLGNNARIDSSFDVGSGFDSTVQDVAVASNGDIYAVGSFTSYDGAISLSIVRINSDGSTDTVSSMR